MSGVEVLGYVATASNVAGNLMLAKMGISGWVVRIATNLLYIAYALQVSDGMPVVANHILFLGINVYGWHIWRRMQNTRDPAR